MPSQNKLTESGRYYRTRFGSIVERLEDPDTKGFMRVRRMSDGALRDWNINDMYPVSDAEAFPEVAP